VAVEPGGRVAFAPPLFRVGGATNVNPPLF